MSAFPVVETFHETEDLEFRLRAGRELNALQQLAFHRGEEALRHGVVETVARRSHRALDARCGALPGEHQRRVLATAVGMECSSFRA